MYRALYSYDGKENDTMPVENGERLVLLEIVDTHWWMMHNACGNVGFVPASYVVLDSTLQNCARSFTTGAIEYLKSKENSSRSGSDGFANDNLKTLIAHQQNKQSLGSIVIPRQPTRAAPSRPPETKAKRKAPEPPSASKEQGDTSASSSDTTLTEAHQSVSTQFVNVQIPLTLGTDIVTSVRQRTGLTFENSQMAAISVVESLIEFVPGLHIPLKNILVSLCEDKVSTSATSDQHSEDEMVLIEILDKLVSHKDDSQQRMWATHEDFEDIKTLLDNLLNTMNECSPAVSSKILRLNDYKYVDSLIEYFQMEIRPKLRLLLLQVFGCFCDLDREFVCHLMYSVLTAELATAVMIKDTDPSVVLYSLLLLTMLFSTGDDLNHNQYDQLNEQFVQTLLQLIENVPEWANDDESIIENSVAVILSFNQHFRDPSSNAVMKVMKTSTTWRAFSERIVLLFNREEDPVAILQHHVSNLPSVLKFLVDLFSTKETSQLFFTNDLYVLIEVVVRQITDRSAGDTLRTEYLSLLYSIILNTNYREHLHMAKQINECLESILNFEDEAVEADLFIANRMKADFADVFAAAKK